MAELNTLSTQYQPEARDKVDPASPAPTNATAADADLAIVSTPGEIEVDTTSGTPVSPPDAGDDQLNNSGAADPEKPMSTTSEGQIAAQPEQENVDENPQPEVVECATTGVDACAVLSSIPHSGPDAAKSAPEEEGAGPTDKPEKPVSTTCEGQIAEQPEQENVDENPQPEVVECATTGVDAATSAISAEGACPADEPETPVSNTSEGQITAQPEQEVADENPEPDVVECANTGSTKGDADVVLSSGLKSGSDALKSAISVEGPSPIDEPHNSMSTTSEGQIAAQLEQEVAVENPKPDVVECGNTVLLSGQKSGCDALKSAVSVEGDCPPGEFNKPMSTTSEGQIAAQLEQENVDENPQPEVVEYGKTGVDVSAVLSSGPQSSSDALKSVISGEVWTDEQAKSKDAAQNENAGEERCPEGDVGFERTPAPPDQGLNDDPAWNTILSTSQMMTSQVSEKGDSEETEDILPIAPNQSGRKTEDEPKQDQVPGFDLVTNVALNSTGGDAVPDSMKQALEEELHRGEQDKLEGAISDGPSEDNNPKSDAYSADHLPLQHSASAVTKTGDISKPRRRKRKPTEFVKSPVPSKADASSFKEAEPQEGPTIFEAQPRMTNAADVSYNAPSPDAGKVDTPSTFEKPPAPSCADVSFRSVITSSQKKAVFSSHASPSMADVNYASPAPAKCTTSLFVSPPKSSTADTGANAAGLTSGASVHKSVYESEARPSIAAVRASDPVPQAAQGPALFTKPPAETKAHARAGVELVKEGVQTPSVFESAPKDAHVAAKWCDPVVAKSSGSVFESKAAPSRADAAADRSLDSDLEYETDTDEE